jgi:hypothetical protein
MRNVFATATNHINISRYLAVFPTDERFGNALELRDIEPRAELQDELTPGPPFAFEDPGTGGGAEQWTSRLP